MKVRIKEKPRETELDGVRLDGYISGMVRDVSSLMGAWLIVNGYAEPEMRETREEDQIFGRFSASRRTRRARPRQAKRRLAH